MKSSSRYAGLFNLLSDGTIRNVVLDSSCSIAGSCSGSDYTYAGGIVGFCCDCTIENSVNMVSITFTGRGTDNACTLVELLDISLHKAKMPM